MKALYVSHSAYDTAGAELAMAEVSGAIVASHQMDICAVVPDEGSLRRRLESLGVEVTTVPDLSWTDFRRLREYGGSPKAKISYVLRRGRSVAHLVRLLRRGGYDVVISNTNTIITPALAARILRIPHVWYVHEFGDKDHDLRYDIGFERSMTLIGRLSRVVMVPSEVLCSTLQQWIPEAKLRVVLYAVDGPRPLPSQGSDSEWRLVLVGRKAPGKGQVDALGAVAILRRMGHPVRLRLVGGGDPSYVASLRTQTSDLGIEPYVEFVDATQDVARHFEWAHVALMCSRAEAFGRVTVEAMKYGRPVIGAAAAGTVELVRHGDRGLLYEPGDAADLAAKVIETMADPRMSAARAERAQQWALQTFSLDRYVQEFTKVICGAVETSEEAQT